MKQPCRISAVALILVSLLLISSSSQQTRIGQDFFESSTGIGPTSIYVAVLNLSTSLVAASGNLELTIVVNNPAAYMQGQLNDNQHEALVYERVVLTGSNISIRCPHFTVQRFELKPRTSRPTLSRPREGRQRTSGHSPVKWFGNHVPLVNLNHLHYGCCDNGNNYNNNNKAIQQNDEALLSGEDAQITTIKITVKLNQTSELSTVTSSEANGNENTEQWTGQPSEALEEDEADASSSSLSGLRMASHEPEFTRENVNEQTTVRKDSNLEFGEQEPCQCNGARWYVNKFGELIINRITADLAGKYTCLVLGKQSDLILHVVAIDNSSNSPIARHRRTFEDGMIIVPATEQSDISASQQTLPAADTDRGVGDDATTWAKASNGSRQSVTGSELRTSTSAFPLKLVDTTISNLFDGDHKSVEENLLGSAADVSSLSQLKSVQDHTKVRETWDGQEVGNQSASAAGLADKIIESEGVKSMRSIYERADPRAAPLILDAKVWIKAPIQSVRLECIQPSYLKSIPSLIFTKQKLHCPIWRFEAEFRQNFVLTLGQTLCSSLGAREVESLWSGRRAFAHSSECHDLVGSFFSQMDTPRSGDNCNASILELGWFKDGEQLEFDDGTGKGFAEGPASNVRLINFCDQLDTGAASVSSCVVVGEQKKSTSDSDKNSNPAEIADIEMLSAEPISKSRGRAKRTPVNWLCPSIGRTLEIDGVRQDSAGHFSCAFKLSTEKLHRYILDMRHRLELQQQKRLRRRRRESIPVRAHNISCCEDRTEQSVKTLQLPVRPGDASTNANETTTTVAVFQSAIPSAQDSHALRNRTESVSKLTSGNEWINLSKLIVKGLEIRLTADHATTHTDDPSGGIVRGDLMAVIQTFSLSVMERSAESCDLWSTISEASNAYSRRKWLNFKRLKRLSRIDKSSIPTAPGQDDDDDYKSKHKLESLSSELPLISAARDAELLSQPVPRRQSMNANLDYNPSSIGPAGTMFPDEQLPLDSSSGQSPTIENAQKSVGHQQDGQQQQFISVVSKVIQEQKLNDKWRLNNADDQSGSDITPSDPGGTIDASSSSFRRPLTMAHETPFNYANERNPWPIFTEHEANKNSIMGIKRGGGDDQDDDGGHKSLRSKRSPTVESIDSHRAHDDKVIDISSNVEIKELITQIGRGAPVMTTAATMAGQSSSLVSDAPETSSELDEPIETVQLAARNVRATAHSEGSMMIGAADGSPGSVIKFVPVAVGGPLLFDEFSTGQRRRNLIGRKAKHNRDQPIRSPTRAHRVAMRRRREASLDGINTPTTSPHRKYDTDEESHSSYSGYGGADVAAAAGLDDDLMWIAGQYLYMEVRAVAGSPLFGAEVSVEWSNERVNDTNSFAPPIDDPQVGQGLQMKDSYSGSNEANEDARGTRDTSPFATIDVIPGQNLHLQCAAHAFGRLPDVKWYKLIADSATISRVNSIEERKRRNLARYIGGQLYWPLEDLDLIGILTQSSARTTTNFVLSQSTTLFNNLVNQTFTVVNNLQLSRNNVDRFGHAPITREPSSPTSSRNLFACMVDADVRHDFVTIGVNFPINDSANRIPVEISKRLRAKAMFERDQAAIRDKEARGKSREPRHLSEKDTTTRLSPLMDPSENKLERSFWIALGNGSNAKINQSFPNTATTLSIMIVVVFGSLLSLVFLTLKSYYRLTSMHFEYSLDGYVVKEPSSDISNDELITTNNQHHQNIGSRKDYVSYHPVEDDGFNLVTSDGDSACTCQINPNVIELATYASLCGSDYSSFQPGMMVYRTSEQIRNVNEALPQTCWSHGPSSCSDNVKEKIDACIVENPSESREISPMRYITGLNVWQTTSDNNPIESV